MLEPALTLAFHGLEKLQSPVYFAKNITKLAVCAIASLNREVPQAIRSSLLGALHSHLTGAESVDITRRSSLGNVQTMLLLGMSPKMHAESIYTGGSRSWLMTGMAIRMALDLVSGDCRLGRRSLTLSPGLAS